MAGPRRTFTRGARRKSLWLQFAPVLQAGVANGGNIIFSLNAAALALRPFTIVRSHFSTMITSDQAAANENQIAGFGLAVVSDEAVAVGVTAVPTPLAQLGSSLWFLNQLLFSEETAATDLSIGPEVMHLDSKAMRKVEVGSDIIVVAEASTIGGGMDLFVGGRILIKTN